MVVTAYPDRDRYLPVIVVEEAGDTAIRQTYLADLWKHQYTLNLQIFAETNTHLYQLRDQLRKWLEGNLDTQEAAGFVDTEIASSISMNWDAGAATKGWQITVRGNIYTETTGTAKIRIDGGAADTDYSALDGGGP